MEDAALSHLGDEIESKDKDDGHLDERFGETKISLQDFESAVKKTSRTLRPFTKNDPEVETEVENDLNQLLGNFLDSFHEVESLSDAAINALLLSFSEQTQEYAAFKKETLTIDGDFEEPLELMSNIDGEIARISFHVLSQRDLPSLLSADAQMRPEIEFTVTLPAYVKNIPVDRLTSEDKEVLKVIEFVEARQFSRPVKFLYAEGMSGSFKSYSRDSSVYRTGGEIVVPENRLGIDPAVTAEPLANAYSLDVEKASRVYFEGGNLRSTNNLLFVGADAIIATMYQDPNVHGSLVHPEKSAFTREQAVALFEEKFGKKVVVIGDEIQPRENFFHIDMFLTPLSDNEVILTQLPKDHPQYEYLEQVAASLHEQMPHMKIHRMPTVTFLDAVLTYSNALVENRDLVGGKKERVIYVPKYVNLEAVIAEKEAFIKAGEGAIAKARSEPGGEYSMPNFERLIAETKAEIAQIRNLLQTANQDAYDYYINLPVDDPALSVRVVQIEVDVRLLGTTGYGGSLNCITNEFRNGI